MSAAHNKWQEAIAVSKLKPISELAVNQAGQHCGYCAVFVEDLIIQSIDASSQLGQPIGAVGVCPSCGDTWEFNAYTFIVTNQSDND